MPQKQRPVYFSKSVAQTKKIAKEIIQTFSYPEIICLYGDLGSGKTIFAKAVGQFFGLEEKTIKSPTYVFYHTHQLPPLKKTPRWLYHFDLYRLNHAHEVEGLGFSEILQQKNKIILIEWPQIIASILPEKRLEIYFTYLNDQERKIEVTPFL